MNISVALATWNGGRYLRDQLESLAAQTKAPHEVVVSDDGSTDETVEILEAFREAAPFAVSIRMNRRPLGYAENFLAAAAMCKGDYIAYCDQDDVWLPSKLARGEQLLAASEALLLIHRNLVVSENLAPTRQRVPRFRRSFTAAPLRVQPWLLAPGNSMIFSRKILGIDFSRRPRGLGANDSSMTHDEWTYFIGTAIGSTYFDSEVLVRYRQHGENIFGAPARSSLRQSVAPGDYRFLAERASERSAFFEAVAHAGSFEPDRCRDASEHYRALATRLEGRAGVYSIDAAMPRRVARFGRLAAAGGYRPRTRGGLGFRSFLKDAIGSVAVGARSPLTVPGPASRQRDEQRRPLRSRTSRDRKR